MDENYKEVYFSEYCAKCKHENVPEGDDPCHECLNEPARLYTHKPLKWESKND